MTHVVTQNCCNDAACVAVCPVNCIHPTPYEPGYATAEMLYIDAGVCIDCGACVEACPVGAISPDYQVTDEQTTFLDLNAGFFADPAHQGYDQTPFRKRRPSVEAMQEGPLRVAVVGSGPAACYAVDELTGHRGLQVEVNVFERLPVPWGLARFGVAPDHQGTKAVTDLFQSIAGRPGVRLHLNVEVGRDITIPELLEHHHAVLYAGGAAHDRRLGLVGEDLPGSHSATDFVAWYNGHPEATRHSFDFNAGRAVVIGNGNVALDVARILAMPVEALAKTDIADHAVEALSRSKIREVVILGRRGPAQASFTLPELLRLAADTSYDVAVDPSGMPRDHLADETTPTWRGSIAARKLRLFSEMSSTGGSATKRVIRFRFMATPIEIIGADHLRGLRVASNQNVRVGAHLQAAVTADRFDIDCGLVLRAIGYRGAEIDGLPFDDENGVVPNVAGRVVEQGSAKPAAGLYVAGWIKRGPSGVIGTNKMCSEESVHSLLADYAAGRLTAPRLTEEELDGLLRSRQPDILDLVDWRRVDEHERQLGRQHSRPRAKLVSVDEILRFARPARPRHPTGSGEATSEESRNRPLCSSQPED